VPPPVPALVTVRTRVIGANVAVTDLAAFMFTEQAPVPVQSPDHPENVELTSGVAVSVMVELLANDAVQVAPQSMPAGELVTVPAPVPAFVTVNGLSLIRVEAEAGDARRPVTRVTANIIDSFRGILNMPAPVSSSDELDFHYA